MVPDTSDVRVTPLGSDRESDPEELDLVVNAAEHGYATGVASDRTTLWVSSLRATDTDGTRKVLRAYVAVGAVANSPAFFGAARFATTLDVEVAENTSGYDLRALDVERGDTLTVAISGADAALFDIDAAGVVTLKNDATFDFESPTDAGNNNVYELTATVTDSKAEDGMGDTDVDQTVALTITVTDEAEGVAAVAASPSPPLVGWPVTAVLTDAVGDVATPTAWAWEVLTADDMAAAAAAADADWATATGTGATTDTYEPVEADLDRFLRVTATHNGDPVRLVTEAVTDVLISNLGQDHAVVNPTREQVGRFASFESRRRTQRFTTGGAEHGYVISGVDAYTDAESDDLPEVSIFSDDSGNPGSRLFVLGNPMPLPDPGTADVSDAESFAADDEVRLAPDTTYHVVFADVKDTTADHGYKVTEAASQHVDGGAARGWSLKGGRVSTETGRWTAVNNIRLGVRGRPLADPSGSKPQAPVGVAFSEATFNSLKVSWVQPPGGQVTDYDVRWREAGQGPADWVDASYDGTDTDFTIEGLTGGFDTDHEVEVRATNSHGMSGWSATATGTTNRRKPGDDIVLATANSAPAGMWSDGTTLWVADTGSGAPLYRYSLTDRNAAATTVVTTGSSGGNRDVWSDGTTLWVAPHGTGSCSGGGSCVLAYDMSGRRRGQSDIATSGSPQRLWSDGATLWVGSGVDDSVAGYDLATGESVRARNLTVRAAEDQAAAAISVLGLWSDGVSLWVGSSVFGPNGSYVRVFPLDGTITRTSAHDLGVAPNNTSDASGVWSDRETLWVSGRNFENDDGDKVLRAYVAVGAVANSPAFFGAARFATTLDVEVAENTSGYDLRALDVERDDTLTVAISGADAALFDIDAAGVITLKNNATFDFESPTDAGNNNVYELTATVRDSKAEDGTDDTDVDQTVALTITVTDEAEGVAAVTASPSPPLVGLPVTAVLTDAGGDDATASASWLWEVADSADATTWATANGDVTNAAAYTPVLADLHRFLRVTATVGTDTVSLVTDLVSAELTSATDVGTLVSNTGKGDAADGLGHAAVSVGYVFGSALRQAVAFTTGDDEDGYLLSTVDAQASIATESGTIAPEASIRTAVSGKPGIVVHSLATGTFDGNSGTTTRFTAADGAVLAPNRTYFVVFEDQSHSAPDHFYHLTPTSDKGEDDGKASGWSIADDRYSKTGNGSWARNTAGPFQIAVRGQAADAAAAMAAVTASPSPPLVGLPVTAVLTDAMGDVATPTAWAWETAATADATTWDAATGDGAATAAYTPVDADLDRFLRVTATHNGDPVRLVTEAVTDVLVSNFGKDVWGGGDDTVGGTLDRAENQRFGASFTTGDADHGYLLTFVDAFTAAESGNVPRVSIYTHLGASRQDHPGRLLYVLDNPSFPAEGEGDIDAADSFEGADQVRLASNTSYYVVFEDLADPDSRRYRLAHTGQDGASTGAPGWSISGFRAIRLVRAQNLSEWTVRDDAAPLIAVRGRALPDPSGSEPAVPSGLVFSDETVDSLKVSWVQPPGAAVTDYDVRWRKTGQMPEDRWVDAADTVASTATTFTIEGLIGGPGTDYDVQVRAGNGDGDSEWSQVFVGTTTRRKPGADIVLHTDNVNPRGMSHDETSLWVADADDAVLYRYALDGTQLATFATPGSTGGNLAVWSDATTVWVVPNGAPALSTALPAGTSSRCSSASGCVWAYNISTGDREPDKEVRARADGGATGLWSDGATLWVAQQGSRGGVTTRDAVAYDLASGRRVGRLDFEAWTVRRGSNTTLGDLWSDGVGIWATVNAEDLADAVFDTSYVRVTPLGSDRMSDPNVLDLVVNATEHDHAIGVASDRETLWVSSPLATHTDGTRKVLRAYAAVGAVANSPAFFTAARFADTLAVNVAENTVGYSLDLRPGDVEGDSLTLGALGGADADKFTLSSGGVITQNPTTTFDFEEPSDADSDTDGFGENTYELTVRVRDAFNAEGGADTTFDHEVDITITVTDVDESGVTVSPLPPVVDSPVEAGFTDSMGDVATPTGWLWEVADAADAADGDWATATGTGATTGTYTPVLADLHRFLRVTANPDNDPVRLVTELVTAEFTSAADVATLVSNTGQTAINLNGRPTEFDFRVGYDALGNASWRQALAFTTGDNEDGYVLSGVDAPAATSHSVTPVVSIRTAVSGEPGVLVHSLTAGTIDSDQATSTSFTAPDGAVLAPNRTYFVVFERLTTAARPTHTISCPRRTAPRTTARRRGGPSPTSGSLG